MIYKQYDLSQSLNGNVIVHIARNPLGAVVFRESSEEKLKKAIDKYLNSLEEENKKAQEKKTQEKLEAKKKTAPTATNKKKLLENRLAEQVAVNKAEPDLEPEKKSFWDRLK